MIDFSKQIERSKRNLFIPDKTYQLPYRHRLGVSVDLEHNNSLIHNVKVGVAFDKVIDRDKVSYTRHFVKELTDKERLQINNKKERETKVESNLARINGPSR